jgi:hypothetical protein
VIDQVPVIVAQLVTILIVTLPGAYLGILALVSLIARAPAVPTRAPLRRAHSRP